MQIILLFQEFADCFPDADFAGSVRIMGGVVLDRLDGGSLDVFGHIKIRFADRHRNAAFHAAE